MARERESGNQADGADNNFAAAADTARDSNRNLEQADDRGGSRDGERLEPGDAGDREQLDNAGGRPQSRR